LVYSTTEAPRVQAKYFEVHDSIRNEQLFVYKRPFLESFLDDLSQMSDFIEIGTYTAGTQEYADEILKNID
jgi:TFIIF-interacting CTD phosphatase-like protein